MTQLISLSLLDLYHRKGFEEFKEELQKSWQSEEELPKDDLGYFELLSYAAFKYTSYQAALEILEKIDQEYPNNPQIACNLALTLMALGRLSEAKLRFQKILKRDPHHSKARCNYGLLLFKEKKFLKALDEFLLAIRDDPDLQEAYYNIALCYLHLEKTEEAIETLVNLQKSYPKFFQAHLLLGKLYLQNGARAKAERLFTDLLPRIKEDPSKLATSLNFLLEYNIFDKALSYALKLRRILPNNEEILYNIGVIFSRQGAILSAQKAYHRVLKINKNHFPTLNNLGFIYLMEKDYSHAQNYFNAAQEVNPSDQGVAYALTLLKKRHGDKVTLEQAPEDYLRRLFDSYAGHYDCHMQYGLGYLLPELIDQELKQILKDSKPLVILDIGCGTGLCGSFLRDRAAKLIGIDISSNMITEAEKKGCYNILQTKSDTHYLKENKEKYDLIIAADVWVYRGDLTEIIALCHHRIENEGLLLFSLEINQEDQQPYLLGSTGRFLHNRNYVAEVLEKNRFRLLKEIKKSLRRQAGMPVASMLYVAQNNP